MFRGGASKTSLEKVFHTCPAGMRPRTREKKSLDVLPEKIAGAKRSLSKSAAPMTELLKLQLMSSSLS